MIKIIALSFTILISLSVSAFSQGCGPTNPNCTVATAPPGTNNNLAASTAFVHQAISGSLPLAQYHFFVGNISNIAVDTALSGDCVYGALGIVCTKTSGVSFGYFATGTDAANLTGTNIVSHGGTGQTSFTANLPLIGNGSGAISQGSRSGNTTSFGTTSGSLTSGHIAKFDISGNIVDGGASATTASGFYTLQFISGAWTCTKPDGTTVSIVGSTTSGLQECINAMQTNKDGNFRAVCPNPVSGTPISATTTVTFGPAAGAFYNLAGCWLETSASPGVNFETLNFGAAVYWPGIIRCSGSPCVDFNPTLPDPLFGSYGIGGAFFTLGSVMTNGCASDSAQSSGVHFNPNGGVAGSHISAIYATKIWIGFLDGYDGSHNCFSAGVAVDNPTNIFAAFGQNYIYIGYNQGFGVWGIENGTGALSQATQALATNHWDIGTIGSANGATTTPTGGFLQYGFLDQIYGNISINGGSLTFGINFNATTANGNWITFPQLDGATPLSDSSTVLKNYGFVVGAGYKTGGSF